MLGDAIKSAQRRGIDDFNRAIYQRTLAPLGPDALKVAQTAPVGNEGIAKVGNVLSDAYNEVLPKITVRLDPPFMQQATQLQSMTASLKLETAAQFGNVLQNEVYNKFTPAGLMSGETMKAVESELGRLARGYSSDPTFDQRQLGNAIQQLQANLRNMVARSNPELAPRVQAINQGWANLTQLENAGSMLGAKEGVVSPTQFLNAVKRSDNSVRDRTFARGEARNQDLAQAGDAVLSRNYPDSGSIGRLLMTGGAGAVLGGGLGAVNPLLPASGLLAMLPYTSWGQKITAGLLARRPQVLDQLGGLLQRAVPYLAAPAAQGLLGADH